MAASKQKERDGDGILRKALGGKGSPQHCFSQDDSETRMKKLTGALGVSVRDA